MVCTCVLFMYTTVPLQAGAKVLVPVVMCLAVDEPDTRTVVAVVETPVYLPVDDPCTVAVVLAVVFGVVDVDIVGGAVLLLHGTIGK
jgi:hypothetical protein